MSQAAAQPDPRTRIMQGNEACVEGALYAGVNFFAGYPITPSSEIAELLSMRLPRVGGRFIQMEDEIAAMGTTIGAALAGAKAMTATSGPGFSLKQENIGYAAMAEIPCVIVNVMRGGPSTGLPTLSAQGDVMQARWGTHGDHPVIALAPAYVRETIDLTVRAVNLAERFRTPVFLMLDEIVGHLTEKVTLPEPGELEIVERPRPDCAPEDYLPYKHTADGIPPMADFGRGYRYHVTGLVHDETGFPTSDTTEADRLIRRLVDKVERARDEIVTVVPTALEDAEVVVVAYGSSARSARRAMVEAREAGLRVGLLRLQTLWPFPDKEVAEVAANAKVLLVPEANLGQMVEPVRAAACGKAEVVPLNKVGGEPIRPAEILQELRRLAS